MMVELVHLPRVQDVVAEHQSMQRMQEQNRIKEWANDFRGYKGEFGTKLYGFDKDNVIA